MFQVFWALFAFMAHANTFVQEKTAAEIKDKILNMTDEESVFIKFYAPWCGHCKAMAPDYEKVAEKLASDGLDNTRHVWNCDMTKPENQEAKEWFSVRGFPTLMNFNGGIQQKYNGRRGFEDMYDYIKNQTYLEEVGTNGKRGQPVSEQTFVITTTTTTTVEVVNEIVQLTDSNFEHLTQASTGATTGAWIVKFYAPWCGHCKRFLPEFQKLANQQDAGMGSDLNVAKADLDTNTGLKTRFNVKGYPTIKLFKNGNFYDYEGGRTAADVQKWYTSGEYKNAKVQGEVPIMPGAFNLFIKQSREVGAEVIKLYQNMFTPETAKVMYNNQPGFFVSSIILVSLCATLIIYQTTTLVLGVAFGTPKENDKED